MKPHNTSEIISLFSWFYNVPWSLHVVFCTEEMAEAGSDFDSNVYEYNHSSEELNFCN